MTDKQIEQIGDFLNGKMGAEERKSFEQKLETDPALLAALNTYRVVEANMQHANTFTSESALKETLDDLNAEFFKASPKETDNVTANDNPSAVNKKLSIQTPFPKKSFFENNKIWKLIAAVFFGAIAMGTWYLLKGKKDNGEVARITKAIDTTNKNKSIIDTISQTPAPVNIALQDTLNKTNQSESKKKEQQVLFAKYFKPDAAPEEKGDALEDAFSAYDKKQYKKAAVAFENADLDVTRGDETDVHLTKFYASYYSALSSMAINMNNKAIKQLESLLTTSNFFFKAKVGWYLALAYLKTGKLEQAILLLGAINKNKGAEEYILKADKLMLDINRMK